MTVPEPKSRKFWIPLAADSSTVDNNDRNGYLPADYPLAMS